MDKQTADKVAAMFNGKVVGAKVLPDHAGGFMIRLFKPNRPPQADFVLELDLVGWMATEGEKIVGNSDLERD